jgi:hypothetical protein
MVNDLLIITEHNVLRTIFLTGTVRSRMVKRRRRI